MEPENKLIKNGEILKQRLAQEYLKEALGYNPDTGEFIWNKRPRSHFDSDRSFNMWNAKYPGETCGNISPRGYINIYVNGVSYRSHRLAFLYMEGYIPENHVDHIDRNTSNNKWSNLREVTQMCNMQNCKKAKNNTSGVTGVGWNKRRKRWTALITVDKDVIDLGRFKSFEDAVMARYQEELNNPKWTCSVESTAYKYLKERNLI